MMEWKRFAIQISENDRSAAEGRANSAEEAMSKRDCKKMMPGEPSDEREKLKKEYNQLNNHDAISLIQTRKSE